MNKEELILAINGHIANLDNLERIFKTKQKILIDTLLKNNGNFIVSDEVYTYHHGYEFSLYVSLDSEKDFHEATFSIEIEGERSPLMGLIIEESDCSFTYYPAIISHINLSNVITEAVKQSYKELC